MGKSKDWSKLIGGISRSFTSWTQTLPLNTYGYMSEDTSPLGVQTVKRASENVSSEDFTLVCRQTAKGRAVGIALILTIINYLTLQ